MAGFLDFLKGAMGSHVTAQPGADLGNITMPDGSQSGPIQAAPTLTQKPGFLAGIDPKALGQAGAGMQDGQDQTQGANPAMQQLLQQQQQRQALIQQLLGGR